MHFHGMVRCGYQTFWIIIFQVYVFFVAMLLFLLCLMSANTDSLIGYVKKTAVAAAVTAVVDVDDDGIKKKSKDDRYAVAAWLVLKMPGKYETYMHQKASYLPIELN